MVGELSQVRLGLTGVDRLEHLGDLAVQPKPARGADLFVEGLPGERSREAIGLGLFRQLGDDARALGLFEKRCAFPIGGEHRLQQAGLTGRRFLGDGGDARARGQPDGVVPAFEYQAQQCRLARAVAPDQADLVAGGNHGAGAVEQNTSGDAIGEIVDP